MRMEKVFNVIYTNTEGEPLCIVHSGITFPVGSDIVEKRRFLEKNYDWLRRGLMREPRGHKDMFGVYLTPPSTQEYDAGLIYMDGSGYKHMCGHGTIAVAMAMVALGMVEPDASGMATVRFETTAGRVVAEVATEEGRVLWTRFENVPAYVVAQDVPFMLPELGALTADIVWGGNYFAIVDVNGTKLTIGPETGTLVSQTAMRVREQLIGKVPLKHPTQKHIDDTLDFVTFWHKPTIEGALYKNVHMFGAGQLDRSPGGTGTSAMMAMLEARGRISVGDTIRSEGLLGSGTFEGSLIGEAQLNNVRAVRPTVKGTASILGSARWAFDPSDDTGRGFLIS